MTDPLRAEIERLRSTLKRIISAHDRLVEAHKYGPSPLHAAEVEAEIARARAALRSTEPPAGLKSEEYRGGAPSPSPRQEPRGDYAPCHGCFFYQGKHSPRCDARGERVAPGVPCSDCRPIPRHSSLDCPVCRPAPEEAATEPCATCGGDGIVCGGASPTQCEDCNGIGRVGIRREGGPPEGEFIEKEE